MLRALEAFLRATWTSFFRRQGFETLASEGNLACGPHTDSPVTSLCSESLAAEVLSGGSRTGARTATRTGPRATGGEARAKCEREAGKRVQAGANPVPARKGWIARIRRGKEGRRGESGSWEVDLLPSRDAALESSSERGAAREEGGGSSSQAAVECGAGCRDPHCLSPAPETRADASSPCCPQASSTVLRPAWR